MNRERLVTLEDAEAHCQQALVNNQFGGIIYCYTNNINGKRYIGQTLHPVKRHQKHCKAEENSVFHHAIKKYGFESFEYCVLEMLIAESRKQISKLLDEAECKYIEKYKSRTHQNGYNVQAGGTYYTGEGESNEKPVDMYSLDGTYIRTFNSVTLANQFCGITGCGIRQTCNHAQHTAGGYLWTWKGEDVVIPVEKQIGCYDLNGNFIKAYDNPFQASKFFGKSYGSINNAIKDRYRIAFGHYWRDYIADSIPITDFPKAFFAYNSEGKCVRGFRCLKDAIRDVNASGASAICAAVTRNNFYRGYLWRRYFVEQLPYEEIPNQGRAVKIIFEDGTIKVYRQILHAAIDNEWEISGVKSALKGAKSKQLSGCKLEYFDDVIDPESHPDWVFVTAEQLEGKELIRPGKINVAVDQYDKCGNLIRTFNSISEAEQTLGLTNVKGAVYRNECCGGFIWTRHGEPIAQSTLAHIESFKVYQYDKEGLFIQEFATKEDAALSIGYSASNSHIGRCTREPWRMAKGFYWRTYKKNRIKIYKNKKEWQED